MDIKILDSYSEVCKSAFAQVEECIKRKQDGVICVATGESPIGIYQLFPEKKDIFQKVKILKLDEWGGIKPDDPSTCESYIKEHIIYPLNLDESQLLGFRSDAKNPEGECERVKQILKELGGIDICILGMGADGHIGLNFPSNSLIPDAHIVPAHYLTHSMLDKAKEKPTHGFTLGMKEIINSDKIILTIRGKSKGEAIKTLLKGEVSTHFPASLLLLSDNLTIYCDKEVYNI